METDGNKTRWVIDKQQYLDVETILRRNSEWNHTIIGEREHRIYNQN